MNFYALFNNNHNTIRVIKNYLDYYEILYSNTNIDRVTEENPYFPSLLSISDTLSEYGVDNKTFRFDKSEFDVSHITTVFIVELKNSHESYFELVNRNKQNNNLEIYNSNKRHWEPLDIELFLRQWTGVALFAESIEMREEFNFKKNKVLDKFRKLKTLALWSVLPFIIVVTSIYSLLVTNLDLFPLMPFLLLSFSGVFVTLLLVWMEIDIDNYSIKNICSANKKINCNAVLESKASKIFGVSWSQIGLFYFIFNLILLSYAGLVSPNAIFFIHIIYILSFPFCIFSIYYQWRVVKQWCAFCLVIQGILIIQFIISIFSFSYIDTPVLVSDIFIVSLFVFLVGYLFTLIIWLIKQVNDLNSKKLKLIRVVNLPNVVKSVLTDSIKIKEFSNVGLIIGDEKSPNRIIKVCNPYCSPCAKSHKMVDEILHANKNVHLQIIFTATPSTKDPLYFPVRHFMALAKLKGADFIHKVLEEWYSTTHKSYENLSHKYFVSDDFLQQEEEIKKMHEWCERMAITETPTFYINGHKLPDNLQLSNLRYLFKNEIND